MCETDIDAAIGLPLEQLNELKSNTSESLYELTCVISSKLQRIEAVGDFIVEHHEDKYMRLFYRLYALGDTKYDPFSIIGGPAATINT